MSHSCIRQYLSHQREFARHTPLTEVERRNYACFVHKKVGDCELPPFHRSIGAEAIVAVVSFAGSGVS